MPPMSALPAPVSGVAPSLDQGLELLIPEDDVEDPEFSIVIPALNEQLTIGEFIEWCKEGLAQAGVSRRDPDRRQLDRPNRRDRPCGRRPRAQGAQARPRPRLHRQPALHPRQVRDPRRLRLHVRLSRDRAVRREVSRRRRVHHGLAVPGLHRARGDAAAAPLPRHAGHDVDLERHLLEPLLGHPLRHARHHAERARADGAFARSRGSTRPRWC